MDGEVRGVAADLLRGGLGAEAEERSVAFHHGHLAQQLLGSLIVAPRDVDGLEPLLGALHGEPDGVARAYGVQAQLVAHPVQGAYLL